MSEKTPQKKHDAVQRAVALRYDQEKEGAPKVIAKGQRILAEKIIDVAKENGIHIHEDPDLVILLSKLELNTEIPEELYEAVAAVLAFVYRLNNRLGAHAS